jgi:hypothetical protein
MKQAIPSILMSGLLASVACPAVADVYEVFTASGQYTLSSDGSTHDWSGKLTIDATLTTPLPLTFTSKIVASSASFDLGVLGIFTISTPQMLNPVDFSKPYGPVVAFESANGPYGQFVLVLSATPLLLNQSSLITSLTYATDLRTINFLAYPFTGTVVPTSTYVTPLPATIPLFASGLGLIGWMARRGKIAPEARIAKSSAASGRPFYRRTAIRCGYRHGRREPIALGGAAVLWRHQSID